MATFGAGNRWARNFLGVIAIVCLAIVISVNHNWIWKAEGGGRVESIYRIGFEPSPWLIVRRAGTGPIDEIEWGSYDVSVDYAHWSALFFAVGVGALIGCRKLLPRTADAPAQPEP